MSDSELATRIAEALLFAAEEPLDAATVRAHLPAGADATDILRALAVDYSGRGVHLECHGGLWAFRTDKELVPYLARHQTHSRRLSRAAIETLAIIAYHQPVTRSDIEELRGVAVSRGTLDRLIEAGWVAPRGRRETPGRPVTWVTSAAFLDHFDLESLDDLPRFDELRAAGLFDADPATPRAVDQTADDDAPAEGVLDEDNDSP